MEEGRACAAGEGDLVDEWMPRESSASCRPVPCSPAAQTEQQQISCS